MKLKWVKSISSMCCTHTNHSISYSCWIISLVIYFVGLNTTNQQWQAQWLQYVCSFSQNYFSHFVLMLITTKCNINDKYNHFIHSKPFSHSIQHILTLKVKLIRFPVLWVFVECMWPNGQENKQKITFIFWNRSSKHNIIQFILIVVSRLDFLYCRNVIPVTCYYC